MANPIIHHPQSHSKWGSSSNVSCFWQWVSHILLIPKHQWDSSPIQTISNILCTNSQTSIHTYNFTPTSAAPPVIGLRTALENLQGAREHQRLSRCGDQDPIPKGSIGVLKQVVYMEVSWHGGSPSSHPFVRWDFPWNKPSIFGDPIAMETRVMWSIHVFTCLDDLEVPTHILLLARAEGYSAQWSVLSCDDQMNTSLQIAIPTMISTQLYSSQKWHL